MNIIWIGVGVSLVFSAGFVVGCFWHSFQFSEPTPLFANRTDKELEQDYDAAIRMRDWYTIDLINDEQERRLYYG